MRPISLPAFPKLMFPLALSAVLAVLAVLPSLAGAEIYKWGDAGNQTQYTQTPPPTGVAAVRIESRVPVGTTGTVTGGSLQERVKASEERQQEADKAAARAEKKAEIDRIIKSNCEAARNNLEALNRSGQIRYRDGEGRVLHLTDEERAQRIEESRMQIEEYCKG